MGYYNWKNIIISKSDKELEEFLENKCFLDIEARYFAINELKRRNINLEKREEITNELINECSLRLENFSKNNLIEIFIIINPFIILALGLYSFINLLGNFELSLNNFWFTSTVFFIAGGLIALIISKYRISKINKRKFEEKNRREEMIDELKK